MSHLSTDEQNRQWVKVTKKLLQVFQTCDKKQFAIVVTGDENWVFYFEPARKVSNTIWATTHNRRPIIAKRFLKAMKIWYAMFFSGILLLTVHILLLNYTIFKTLGQFENFVFVIMSTSENIRLIARTSLIFVKYNITQRELLFAQSLQSICSVYVDTSKVILLVTVFFILHPDIRK